MKLKLSDLTIWKHVILTLIYGAAPLIAGAAIRTWTGSGLDANWSTSNNWTPAGAPQNGDVLVFPGSTPHMSNVNNLNDLSIQSIVFSGSGYLLSGNLIHLQSHVTGTHTFGSDTVQCYLDIGAAGAYFETADVGRLDILGDVILNSNCLLGVYCTSGPLVISGAILGNGQVIKYGTNSLTLAGNYPNSFTGPLTIREGTNYLAKPAGVNAVPCDFILGHRDDFKYGYAVLQHPHQIADIITTLINHGGLDLNGWDEALGPIHFYDGEIKTGTGTLQLLSPVTQLQWIYVRECTIRGTLYSAGDTVFQLDDTDGMRVYANITGPGGLIQNGGLLYLGGTNSFPGPVTNNFGVMIVLDQPLALGTGSQVTLNYGGLELWGGSGNAINKNLFLNSEYSWLEGFGDWIWTGNIHLDFLGEASINCYSDTLRILGALQGTGGVWFGDGGAIELLGNNTYTGRTIASCGLLSINNGSGRPFSDSLEVGGQFRYFDQEGFIHYDTNPSCELRFNSSAFTVHPSTLIHGNGFVNLNGHDKQINAITFLDGGHVSSGAGRLYSGSITSNPASTPALIDGNLTPTTNPLTVEVWDGSAVPDLQIAASISDLANSYGIRKLEQGELLFSAANAYDGLTTIEAGTLHIQDPAGLGSTAAGTTVLDGGTLEIENVASLSEFLNLSGLGHNGTDGALKLLAATTDNGPITLTTNAGIRVDGSFAILSGVLSGPGGFTKLGAGTLQLGGGAGTPNTYSGDTIVNEGILVLFKPSYFQSVGFNLIVGSPNGGLFPPATVARLFSHDQIGGGITVNRGGLLDLFGFDEYSGNVALNGGGDIQTGSGTLYLAGDGVNVSVTPDNFPGQSVISGKLGLYPGTHTFTVNGQLTFLSGPDLDVPATIFETSASASIVKNGFGAMRFRAANNYSGTTTINDGSLIVSNSAALGSISAGTIVNNAGALALDGGIWVQEETLTLNSTNPAALVSLGAFSNSWVAPITLQRTAGINVPGSGGILNLMSFFDCCGGSFISGPGGLTKTGPGKLLLAGFASSGYGGPTTVTGGTLEAARFSGGSVRGDVVVDGIGSVLNTIKLNSFATASQLSSTASVTIRNGGVWNLGPDNSETVRALFGDASVNLSGGGSLTVDNPSSCTFSGVLSGTGALNKRGTATLLLSGNSPGFTGLASVFAGALNVNGNMANTPVTVHTNAELGGGGVLGTITATESGSLVRPGSPVPERQGGALEGGNVSLSPGGSLNLDFFGPSPTGGNDALVARGSASVSGAGLSAAFAYPPHEGDVLTVLRKNSAGPISGTFTGWADGITRQAGNVTVRASYTGGDGNDLTLTVTNLPLAAGGAQLVSGSPDNALVPNDCDLLWLVVTNRSGSNLYNLHGTLRSLTPGLVVTIGEATFPNLAPTARATNATPFQIRTDPTFPCNGAGLFELVLSGSNVPPFAIVYSLLGGSRYALDFDGIDDRVEPASPPFTSVFNSFTIELWANPTGERDFTPETSGGMFDFNQRFAIYPDQADLIYGGDRAGAGLSIGTNGISVFENGAGHFPSPIVYAASLSGWTHVALVYINGAPQLYVNGALVRVAPHSLKPFVHPSVNLGGTINAPGDGPYQGQIDEVRIWNVALSQTQIQTNMNRQLTGSEANLILYYRCDEGSGLTIGDSAPASPNTSSTLANGAAFVPSGVAPFSVPGGPNCSSGGGSCESCNIVSGHFTTNTPGDVNTFYFVGAPSICDPPRSCPGADPSGTGLPVAVLAHSFTNSTTNVLCVTAQLRFGCPGAPTNAFGAVAYLGAYDSNNLCAGYLGDTGADGTQAFSFRVPPGTNFIIRVSTRSTNIVCQDYTLELFDLPCPLPAIAIAREAAPAKARVHWSTAYPGWTAQDSAIVAGPFSNVVQIPAIVNSRYALTNVSAITNHFYRLRKTLPVGP